MYIMYGMRADSTNLFLLSMRSYTGESIKPSFVNTKYFVSCEKKFQERLILSLLAAIILVHTSSRLPVVEIESSF
jgi:hypothetical protein